MTHTPGILLVKVEDHTLTRDHLRRVALKFSLSTVWSSDPQRGTKHLWLPVTGTKEALDTKARLNAWLKHYGLPEKHGEETLDKLVGKHLLARILPAPATYSESDVQLMLLTELEEVDIPTAYRELAALPSVVPLVDDGVHCFCKTPDFHPVPIGGDIYTVCRHCKKERLPG